MRQTLVPGASFARDGGAPLAEEPRSTVTGASGRTYTLDAVPLGVGGQAEVWPGVAPDGTRVAIKIAHRPGKGGEGVAQEAALLEALTAAGYAYSVACLDRVDVDGRPGFVMPLHMADVDAHVARLVETAGGQGIEAVLGVATGLARALADLHAVALPDVDGRLVHRDVKPENVLVDADGRLLLGDFGGSLVVDGTTSLELGVFGSPLWAPFDQMLPGLPEPNPTWDTYAACVMLFWWITGGRPAYQADPSPMLTERGRATWAALCALGEADSSERLEAVRAMFAARDGTRAAELVDVRGLGAIQDADRAALTAGVNRLADPARYGEVALADTARDLGDLLARGLSPLSHPSPPNRYWRAADLAEELESIAARLAAERRARAGERERAGLRAQVKAMKSQPTRRSWLAGAAVTGAVLTAVPAVAALAWVYEPEPQAAEPTGPDVVEVMGGTTVHGDVWGDGEADERPTREVTLPTYRIHRTEVSNAGYAACVETGVCSPLAWQDPASSWHLDAKQGAAFAQLTGANQPAVGVTWQQAATYCAWSGGRLPTEEEWEKAATAAAGEGKRRWPWGAEDPDCTRVNAGTCGLGRTLAVDSLPGGASASGARHMAGNAWEWTTGSYTVVRRSFFRRTSQEEKVLRGGSFDSTKGGLRPTFRRHDPPETVSPLYGFRCVFDGPGEP